MTVNAQCFGPSGLDLIPEQVCPGEDAKARVRNGRCGPGTENCGCCDSPDPCEVVWEYEVKEGARNVKIEFDPKVTGIGEWTTIHVLEGEGEVLIRARDHCYPDCYTKDEKTLKIGCTDCGGGGCAAGSASAENNSVDFEISMGKLVDGKPAGRLTVHAETPSADLGTPAGLRYTQDGADLPRVEVFRHYVTNDLRQIKTPEMLADIIPTTPPYPDGYMVRCYYDEDVWWSGMTWLWEPNQGAEPFAAWGVFLLVSNDDYELHFEQLVGGSAEYIYLGTEGSRDWILHSLDGGTQQERVSVEWQDMLTHYERTREVQRGGVTITQVITQHAAPGTPWTYQTVVINGGDDLGTQREFYDAESDWRGHLKWQHNSDGSWLWNTFEEAAGELINVEYSGWGDTAFPVQAPTDPATAGLHARKTIWDTRFRVRLMEEYADGHLVAKTEYVNHYDGDRLDWQEVHQYYTSGAYLVSKVYYDPSDPDNRRLRRVEQADGSKTCYEHGDGMYSPYAPFDPANPTYPSSTGDYRTTTVIRCSDIDVNGSPIPLPLRSTKEYTVVDPFGRQILAESSIWTGQAWQIIQRMTWGHDALGRVTDHYRLDPDDNSVLAHEQTDWSACCGDRTVTDADGVVTTYEYDLLGRPSHITKAGVEGLGAYAAQSDVVTSYFHGSVEGLASVRTEVSGYDGAAEITNRVITRVVRDAAGRVVREQTLDASLQPVLTTQYAYANGGRTVTKTRPDGQQETTEYYRDGRVKAVSGVGTIARAYRYEVDPSDGTQVTWVLEGTSDPNAQGWPRWTKTTYDLLGREIKDERPAYGSGTLATIRHYNALGQLERVEQPGQADTLYAYDQLGSVWRTGLDLGAPANGSLNPADPDRFTESWTTYQQGVGGWWRITKSVTYGEDSQGNPSSTAIGISGEAERLTGFSGGLVRESRRVAPLVLKAPGEFFGAMNPVREIVTVTRDPLNQLVTATTNHLDSSQDSQRIIYNGLLVSETTQTGVAHSLAYDGIGRQIAVTDGRGNATEYRYFQADEDHPGELWWAEDATGQTTTYDYYVQNELGAGGIAVVENAAGNKTRYAYDELGRIAYTWGDVPQPTWIQYDAYGQRWKLHTYRTDPGWTGTSWPSAGNGDVTTWTYDPETGLLTGKTDAQGETVQYTYYADGRLYERLWARLHQGTPLKTTYTYDPDTGDLSTITYSDNTPAVAFTYNRLGRMETVTDAAGTRTMTYDNLTLQLKAELFGGGLFDGVSVARQYESTSYPQGPVPGRFTGFTVTQNSQTIYDAAYHYDTSGRMNRVTGPGLPAYGAVYGYLADGQTPLADYVATVDYRVDEGTTLARTTRQFETDRDLVDYVENAWVYDSGPVISKYDYTNDTQLGLRTNVAYSGAAFGTTAPTQSFGYNERNELDVSTRSDKADPTWDYDYDPIGNRVTTDDAVAGKSWTYERNGLNQYHRVQANGEAQGFRYDDDGNLVEMFTAGDMNCDGTTNWTDIDYFVAASASDQCPPDPPTVLVYGEPWPENCSCLNGDFNNDGQVNWRDIDPFTGAMNSVGATRVFTWDAENRLVCVAPTPGHEQAGNFKVEFVYDYMGRRVAKQVRVWDPAGGGGAGAWSDDPADGAYVRKFVWSGWLMLMELDSSGGTGVSPVRSYTWGLDLAGQNGSVNSLEAAGGIGGLLALRDTNGTPTVETDDLQYAYFYDANGNVGQLVDWTAKMTLNPVYAWAATRLVARYEYDPYGTVIGPDTDADGDWTDDAGPYATVNAVRFSTKYFDDETGLGYWGYRYYSPGLGRWISRDPRSDDDGPNILAYVHNCPTLAIDARGLWTLGLHKQIAREAFDGIKCPGKYTCGCMPQMRAGVIGGSVIPDVPEGVLGYLLRKCLSQRSHHGDLQYWHGMWSGEKTAADVRENIIGHIITQAMSYHNEDKCRKSGQILGIGAHTLADTYCRSHVARDSQGRVTRFQDYAVQQNHGQADKEKGSSEYSQAVAATTKFFDMVICEEAGPEELRKFLETEVLPLAPNAVAGGTEPEFQ